VAGPLRRPALQRTSELGRKKLRARTDEVLLARRLGSQIEAWSRAAARDFPWRHWSDTYRLTVVEVLLQRTRATVVEQFVSGFFSRFPSWESIATAPVSELEQYLSGIGLHIRRAAVLKALATYLQSGNYPSEDAPGIGQYIGRAIQVAEVNAKLAMVDSNWVRVLHRVFSEGWMADYRYDPRLQQLAQSMVDGATDSRSLNWAVLDLGATVCLPRNPLCPKCPIATACSWAATAQLSEARPT